MAALHEALKALGPCNFEDAPLDSLGNFLSEAFAAGETIVESVPPPSSPPTSSLASANRSRAASSASEISQSSARSSPPPADIEALQKEWKAVKLGAKENPLGMSVYKMNGKDGKGSWFARRSVHEGLGFRKWKRALEKEFPETLKVKGGPGEGNIRGIGGEDRVEHRVVDGVGKLEVYLLSAQFPGPTAPRDFVTMFLTSENALEGQEGEETPRHFMVISKPCNHPETPPRDGYIRGQYESVEFIREIPTKKPRKSFSTTQLDQPHSKNRSSTLGKEAILRNASQVHPEEEVTEEQSSNEGARARGSTISFDRSRGAEAKGERMDVPQDDDDEENPVEWIMITRSDPGGSVPRFLIDRGTPGGIVGDAGKFLDWACGKDIEDFEEDEVPSDGSGDKPKRLHRHDTDLHNYQTNGHLAGLQEEIEPEPDSKPRVIEPESEATEPFPNVTPPPSLQSGSSSGLYGMFTGGIGAAGGFLASHTPQIISERFASPSPEQQAAGKSTSLHESAKTNSTRRESTSSISTVSSINSFTSALEQRVTTNSVAPSNLSNSTEKAALSPQERELQKLEEKKRKLDEKLAQARLRDSSKATEDTAKEEAALTKATERHSREIKKQEEKYKKEVLKLQQKREKEERKAEERRKKAAEKDEKVRLQREIEELKGEVGVLRKEKEILRLQVGELQRENTLLAAKVGKLPGGVGEDVLRSVREEALRGGGLRARASSLKIGSKRPTISLERKNTGLSAPIGTANGLESGNANGKENIASVIGGGKV